MAARKNAKTEPQKPLTRKKRIPIPTKKYLDNAIVKTPKDAAQKSTAANLRKRKTEVLEDNANNNVERNLKRRKVIPNVGKNSISHSTRTATRSSKVIPVKEIASKVKRLLNGSLKRVRKTTTDSKTLKTKAKSTKKVAKLSIVPKRTPRKTNSKKVTASVLPKKRRIAKKIVNDSAVTTEPIIQSKKKKSNKNALVPRDFVTEYIKEPTFETRESLPHVSTLAHSRLLIRAVNLNDTKMLKTLVNDKKSICSFAIPRSLNINRDALSYALEKQNIEAIKILFDSKLSKNLASFPDIIISEATTGYNSTMMFGHAMRRVTVGRGGKEGNNALLKDSDTYNQSTVNFLSNDMAREALSLGVPKTFLQKLSQTLPELQSNLIGYCYSCIIYAIRAGHNQLAGQLVDETIAKGGYGFNQLHKEVLLNTVEPLTPFKSVSVIKKVIYNDRITPLHCAAINPNSDYLNALLNSRPDYTIVDMQNWSIMHYAAVCTGTGPLKLLLARGISTIQANKDGDTPLHLAAALGRLENIKLILKSEKENEDDVDDDIPKDVSGSLVQRTNKVGETALHKASAAGHGNIVSTLLTAGSDPNKFTPARYDKLTPFMLAARHGHVDVLKTFLQHGYMKIDAVDHKGRSALTHAIINGQAHVVSYLLRIGANNLKKDTSGNTLVHYAAAYGWYFCLKLLLESGCPANEPNDWKLTPLTIGFMKGHIGLVEYILKQPGVDINSRVNDNTGFTLLLQAVCSQPTKGYLSRLKFLLEDQKANCNILDFEGNNAFHYVVITEYREMSKDSNYKNSEARKILFETTKLLWNHQCDPNVRNSSKETAITLAVQYGCFSTLNHFYDLSSTLPEQPNHDRNNLLHLMVNQASNDEMIRFCERLAKDPTKLEMLKQMAAAYNKSGYTPLLWLLHRVPSVISDKTKNIVSFMKFLVETLGSDVAAVDREEKCGQSVTHLATTVNYAEEALNIILPLQPQLEILNYHQQTPLTYAIVKSNEMAAAVLLRNGANVNVKMTNMNSLLLLHSVSQNKSFHLVPLMIDVGAGVHEINRHTKNSILHYVCRKPHLPFAVESVRKLVDKNIDLDAVNKDGRTALHLAVNFRAGETDASYDIEDVLIASKAKLNIRDHRGRIPLHMAFVKIGKHTDTSFMDPIELVTTLVRAMKQSLPNFADEIRLADEFGMTPLHYAAARGATISCSYLLMEMNENTDIFDCNGNTPFGLAVLNGHEGCALQFQQKGANFVTNLNTNLTQSIPSNEHSDRAVAWEWIIDKKMREHNDRMKLEKENYPILQEVVSKDWQGMLHLMLEKLNNSGIGATFPIAAAMNTGRLKLAKKLAMRAQPSEINVNDNGETLLHIMAKNVIQADINNRSLSEQIVDVLISKGISYDALDKDEATALICAAANKNTIICNLLSRSTITEQNEITSLAYSDMFGRNPFSALFWNLNSCTEFSDELKMWAESIVERGADANSRCRYPIIYPVEYSGVRFLYSDRDATFSAKYTPLMMAVIAGNYAVVQWLLTMKNGTLVDVNYQDVDGRTALMHAVKLNDIKMVRLLINPIEGKQNRTSGPHKNRLLFNVTDKKGWTVFDHIVAAHEGTNFYYANSDAMVRVLFSAGAKINEKSGDGVTPLQRAISMKRFHLVKCIEELLKVAPVKRTSFTEENRELFEVNVNRNVPCYALISNYDQDCQMEIGNVMETEQDSEESDDDSGVEADDLMTENNRNNYKIMFDTEQQVHFYCVLTKVDISYGVYGLYNFYNMQLVKQDRGKELIVLLTRWGRVGDNGQYQKTPFPSEEQAINEFKKIFRSKTGNTWDNIQSFSPIPSKYRLVDLQAKKTTRPGQVKIDFDKFRRMNNKQQSNLPMTLLKLFESLVMIHENNIKLSDSDDEFENDTLSSFTSETLKRGADLLASIEQLIRKRDELKQKPEYSVKNEIDFMESVLKPSEEFYSLIPIYGCAKEKLRPMFSLEELKEKQKAIHKLIHLEFASKLIFAAQYNLNVVNPFEYVSRCLDTKLEVVMEEEEEAQLILQYIRNTSTHPEYNTNSAKVNQIFRLERSGEAERMKNCGIGNRHLLWHGTSAVNVLSILQRGLQVTPLEATLSGHLFGHGIYFADMFMKSQKYSHGKNPRFMFLCEVALGTIHPIKLQYYGLTENTPLPSHCHSLKTADSRWEPDPSSTVVYKGRTVPLGRTVENVLPEHQYHGLDHNEFVVFKEDQVQLRYLVQYEE